MAGAKILKREINFVIYIRYEYIPFIDNFNSYSCTYIIIKSALPAVHSGVTLYILYTYLLARNSIVPIPTVENGEFEIPIS